MVKPEPQLLYGPGCITGYTHLQPGVGFDEHLHQKSTEILMATQGTITVSHNGEKVTLSEGESVSIAPGVPHTVRNCAKTPSTVAFIRYPGDVNDVFYTGN